MMQIQVVTLEAQCTASVHDQVRMDDLRSFFGRALSAVSDTLAAEGLAPAGPPFACYHGSPTDVVEVEAGYPVAEPVPAADAVLPGVLPAGTAVEGVHVGPYDELPEAYAAIQRRMAEEGLEPGDLMWEYYLTDPGTEPDPAKWQTRIVWPVR